MRLACQAVCACPPAAVSLASSHPKSLKQGVAGATPRLQELVALAVAAALVMLLDDLA